MFFVLEDGLMACEPFFECSFREADVVSVVRFAAIFDVYSRLESDAARQAVFRREDARRVKFWQLQSFRCVSIDLNQKLFSLTKCQTTACNCPGHCQL